MVKKYLSLLSAVALTVTIFSSCGSKNEKPSNETTANNNTESVSSQKSKSLNIENNKKESKKCKIVNLNGVCSTVITEEGYLFYWGHNLDTDLFSKNSSITVPQKFNINNQKIKSVCFGESHSAVVTEDGHLYIWGNNNYSQLGYETKDSNNNGILDDTTIPQELSINNQKIKTISLGSSHSAAITEDGSLYTWGNNYFGELGDGTQYSNITPQKINLDNKKVKSVSLEDEFSAAVTEDGCLYAWGCNINGQIGDGTTSDKNTPQKINVDNKKVKQASFGYDHAAAVTEDGGLYIWGGCNENGQLGIGTTSIEVNITKPQRINVDNKKVIAVSLGSEHSAAITEDGNLYTWGKNDSGQLGYETEDTDNDGKMDCSTTPHKINVDNKKVKSISLGSGYSATLTEDESVYTWGDNSYGRLGYETQDASYSATPQKVIIE